MAAWIREGALALLRDAAATAYPREACGVLVGLVTEGAWHVEAAIAAENLAGADAGTRFVLDPAALVAAEDEARAAGRVVLGVWHSHPDGPATLSEADRAAATASWLHVVVAVPRGVARDVRAWRVSRRAAREEALACVP